MSSCGSSGRPSSTDSVFWGVRFELAIWTGWGHHLCALCRAHAQDTNSLDKIQSLIKKWAKKAVEIGREDIQEHLEKELQSYKNKMPWRENKAKEREGQPKVDRSKLKTI